MKEKFYITSSIAYANGDPHLGHALELTQTDVLARHQRSLGREVFFLTGTDEHGTKIARTAEERGEEVENFVEKNVGKFKELVKSLDVSNDDFIRTTDQERHWSGAQAVWRKMSKAGDIYKSKYKGLYCVGCEAFIKEGDLVNGKCQYHDKEPETIEEENYFLKLSKYQDQIKKVIESGELNIAPASRKNEILAMLNRGLDDVSISRPVEKLSWGIPVPDDSTQVMYVWVDALSNYISALGYGLDNRNNFDKFWPADMHVIGKDILRFHALIWPAMLMSIGIPLPKQIFVHGFITMGGKRMSKSAGHMMDPFALIEEYGKDALRYYLLREITPFEDGDITEEKFKEAYNANLANGLGNLVGRIMKMSENYLETRPSSSSEILRDLVSKWMEEFEMNKAMDEIWKKISELDLRIQETQPFKLIKTDEEKAKEIVRGLVIGLGEVAEALTSFLPETSEKIFDAIKNNKMPEPLFLRKN